jgi:hypothetical protein
MNYMLNLAYENSTAGTSCWMDKKANISAQLKEASKQCQTPPKDRSGQGKSLPEVWSSNTKSFSSNLLKP